MNSFLSLGQPNSYVCFTLTRIKGNQCIEDSKISVCCRSLSDTRPLPTSILILPLRLIDPPENNIHIFHRLKEVRLWIYNNKKPFRCHIIHRYSFFSVLALQCLHWQAKVCYWVHFAYCATFKCTYVNVLGAAAVPRRPSQQVVFLHLQTVMASVFLFAQNVKWINKYKYSKYKFFFNEVCGTHRELFIFLTLNKVVQGSF